MATARRATAQPTAQATAPLNVMMTSKLYGAPKAVHVPAGVSSQVGALRWRALAIAWLLVQMSSASMMMAEASLCRTTWVLHSHCPRFSRQEAYGAGVRARRTASGWARLRARGGAGKGSANSIQLCGCGTLASNVARPPACTPTAQDALRLACLPSTHPPTHPPHSADPMAARCHSGCHTASCKGAGAATVSLTRGRVLVVAHVFAGEHTCGRPSDLQPVSSTGSWMPCTNFPCRPCILSSMAAMHAACLAFFSIHTSHVLPLTPTCSCMPWGRPAWKTGCPP